MDSPSVFPPPHPCSVAPPPSYLSPHHKPLDHFASSILRVFRTGAIIILANVGRAENRQGRPHLQRARMEEEQEKRSQLEIRATHQPQQQPAYYLPELLTGVRSERTRPCPTVCARFVWKAVFSQVQKIAAANPGARFDKWACRRKVVASPFKNSLDSHWMMTEGERRPSKNVPHFFGPRQTCIITFIINMPSSLSTPSHLVYYPFS